MKDVFTNYLSFTNEPISAAILTAAQAILDDRLRSYTVREAAMTLRTDPRGIYRLVKQGRLRPFKVGETNGMRFSADVLRNFMDFSEA